MYVVKLKGEDRYLKLDRMYKKHQLTTSILHAKTFSTDAQAESFIKNSIPKKVRSNYEVIKAVHSSYRNPPSTTFTHVDPPLNKEPKVLETVEEVKPPPVIEDKQISIESLPEIKCECITDVVESLEFDYSSFFTQLDSVLRMIPKHADECRDKLHSCELALTDIRHYIEFINVNTIDGYKLYKYQQDLLRLRRKLKDEIKISEIIMSDIINKGARADNVANYCTIREERTYCPRILSSLFKKGIHNLREEDKELT